MNVKKIAAVGASAVIYLASAAPAFATGWSFPWFGGSDELSIHNEDTRVVTNVTTKANTGHNEVGGGSHHGWFWWWGGNDEAGSVVTGNAVASAQVGQEVNTSLVEGCGCFDDVTIHNDNTYVMSDVYTKANSGYNHVSGAGSVGTGGAAAGSVVTQLVNMTMVGGSAN